MSISLPSLGRYTNPYIRCGKTLEEIELLFSKDGPKPWKTSKGGSRLFEEMDRARQASTRGLSFSEFNDEKMKSNEAAGGQGLGKSPVEEHKEKV